MIPLKDFLAKCGTTMEDLSSAGARMAEAGKTDQYTTFPARETRALSQFIIYLSVERAKLIHALRKHDIEPQVSSLGVDWLKDQ